MLQVGDLGWWYDSRNWHQQQWRGCRHGSLASGYEHAFLAMDAMMTDLGHWVAEAASRFNYDSGTGLDTVACDGIQPHAFVYATASCWIEFAAA